MLPAQTSPLPATVTPSRLDVTGTPMLARAAAGPAQKRAAIAHHVHRAGTRAGHRVEGKVVGAVSVPKLVPFQRRTIGPPVVGLLPTTQTSLALAAYTPAIVHVGRLSCRHRQPGLPGVVQHGVQRADRLQILGPRAETAFSTPAAGSEGASVGDKCSLPS